MATYAIGDVQGCFNPLMELLDAINFDAGRDRLWLVGDLVNRGSDSLAVLEFVIGLGDRAVTVLGNHDLHLLAVGEGLVTPKKADTLEAILCSPDKPALISWLRRRPLMHHDSELQFSMLHAGLPPQWTIADALECASEAEAMLSGGDYCAVLRTMYGNEPNVWDDHLGGDDRLRFIINCFTRMRYLDQRGHLNFLAKGAPGREADHLIPWFTVKHRKSRADKIVFGHWSTLRLGNLQDFTSYNVYPLDTGCLWGGRLTALRLEDERLFSVPGVSCDVREG